MTRVVRSLCVLALCFVAPSALCACDTGAVNIEDCRRIEYARCDAAEQCGQIPDAEECRLFYRDHCLHGLPLTPDGVVPAQVQRCADTIEAAGDCALSDGEETLAGDCSDPVTARDLTARSAVCDIVLTPETHAAECAFLSPETDAGARD